MAVKLGMFIDRTLLAFAQKPRCCVCVVSGSWWHLVLGL